jgi:hypothetical protein
MPTPSKRPSRLVLLIPLAAIIAAMAVGYAAIASGRVDSSTGSWHESERRTRNFGTSNPVYATQSGSLKKTRATHIEFQNDENYDASYEACWELGLDHLSRQFQVSRTPEAIAEVWAANELPAFHEGTYQGCRDALRVNAPPPFRKPDTAGRTRSP